MMIDNVIMILWNRRNHQDNLVHTRLNWLIAAQAFLIIAFFNASGLDDPPWWVLLSIPIVGILSTSLVYKSILAGIATYKDVRDKLHNVIEFHESEQVKKEYSKTLLVRDWSEIIRGGFLPCLIVPCVFLAFWYFLFLWAVLSDGMSWFLSVYCP